MDFASNGRVKKLQYASYLAAAFAYLMIRQRDAVGLAIYDEKIREYLPPRSTKSYLNLIYKELANIQGGRKTGTAPSLHEIAERIKRRGLVVILSDFFDNPDQVVTAFKHFRHRKNEVIIIQILDPLEKSFAFGRDALFKDMETSEEMITQPWHIQKAYQEEMRKFLERYKKECRENGIDYLLVDTATPFDVALLEYLRKRQRLR